VEFPRASVPGFINGPARKQGARRVDGDRYGLLVRERSRPGRGERGLRGNGVGACGISVAAPSWMGRVESAGY